MTHRPINIKCIVNEGKVCYFYIRVWKVVEWISMIMYRSAQGVLFGWKENNDTVCVAWI